MALYINQRRSGNTIRIVDELIQDLFTKGECACYDHYGDGTLDTRNRRKKDVMRMVLRRLESEHGGFHDIVEFNQKTFTIKLITPKTTTP